MATNPQRTQFGSLGFVEVVFLGPMYILGIQGQQKNQSLPSLPSSQM